MTTRKSLLTISGLSACLLFVSSLSVFGQAALTTASGLKVLTLREQADQINAWMEARLDAVLPALMRRTGIDMWLVINREYNEDPVYFTLVPRPALYSSGTVALIFHDKGPRPASSGSAARPTESAADTGTSGGRGSRSQFETLADFIKQANPKKIGINVSAKWPLADGLSVVPQGKGSRPPSGPSFPSGSFRPKTSASAGSKRGRRRDGDLPGDLRRRPLHHRRVLLEPGHRPRQDDGGRRRLVDPPTRRLAGDGELVPAVDRHHPAPRKTRPKYGDA